MTTTDDELLALAEAVLADPKNAHFDLLDATPPLEAYVDAVHPHRVKALVMRVKELEALPTPPQAGVRTASRRGTAPRPSHSTGKWLG